MKRKSSRRRIDVNLDELDQIIERGTQAPLSKGEGQKLKTALHAMADRLIRKSSTEKTSAALDTAAAATPAPKSPTDEAASAGHGRNSAAAFTGAQRFPSRMPHSTPVTLARNAAREKYIARKSRRL